MIDIADNNRETACNCLPGGKWRQSHYGRINKRRRGGGHARSQAMENPGNKLKCPRAISLPAHKKISTILLRVTCRASAPNTAKVDHRCHMLQMHITFPIYLVKNTTHLSCSNSRRGKQEVNHRAKTSHLPSNWSSCAKSLPSADLLPRQQCYRSQDNLFSEGNAPNNLKERKKKRKKKEEEKESLIAKQYLIKSQCCDKFL